MFIRFFAVKKRQLNLCGQIWMLPKYSTQFQQQTRARAAIVRSDKPEGVESLRIVVGAQQKRRRAVSCCRKSGNQIHKPDLAARRVIRECLSRHLPTRQTQLILDVIPGFFDRLRSRWTRTEVNQPSNMIQSFLAGNFFPNAGLRGTRRLPTNQ
jgi:hypothetical protein